MKEAQTEGSWVGGGAAYLFNVGSVVVHAHITHEEDAAVLQLAREGAVHWRRGRKKSGKEDIIKSLNKIKKKSSKSRADEVFFTKLGIHL